MPQDQPTYDVLGVPITVTTSASAALKIEEWARDRTGRFVCARDVASLMAIIDDPDLRGVHEEAAMIMPDGKPIAMVGKVRGLPVERTCGSDLFELVCRRSVANGLSHYFYGGKDGVARRLAETMQRRFPGIRIAGCECPPFRELTAQEDRAVIKRIRQSGADIVWVGLSSPKQDRWMRDHYRALPQTLVGIGAAFDFHAGTVRRAPLWMQKGMLEWAFRLLQEPKRLWRRYLVLAPKFVLRLVASGLSR